MSDKKVYLTWDKTAALTKQLSRIIHLAGVKYDVFMAIARGGLFPALLLAQDFDHPLGLSTHMRRYGDEQTDSAAMPRILTFPIGEEFRNRRVLVIDEVWDRGDSIIRAEHEVQLYDPKLIHTAVLHFKPTRNRYPMRQPTYFVEETSDWIVYPWETFADKVTQPDGE